MLDAEEGIRDTLLFSDCHLALKETSDMLIICKSMARDKQYNRGMSKVIVGVMKIEKTVDSAAWDQGRLAKE